MADSDNSRTLPAVTRRRLLSVSAAWLAAQLGSAEATLASNGDVTGDGDPLLVLWCQWMTAKGQAEKLCELQQRLESRMISEIGFPRVVVTGGDREAPVSAFSVDEIDALFGDGPERAGARAQARAALAEQQSKWDALDERLGYSRAKHAERSAVAARDERAHALWAKPARSRAGVAAKLHAILCMGREDCPDDEFPWPQISAILRDIVAGTDDMWHEL